MMAERFMPDRNPGPTRTAFQFVPGMLEHLEIGSKLACTGALNRATYITAIDIMKDAVGYGYKTCRDECHIVIRTHDMLAYTRIPDADKKHQKKVIAALKKIDKAAAGAVDVDKTFDYKMRLTGDEQARAKYPHLFR